MWTCQDCKEEVEESFDVCWNCGTSRDGVPDKEFVNQRELDSFSNPVPLSKMSRSVDPPLLECAKCGEKKVIPSVRIIDSGKSSFQNLNVQINRNPAAFLFTGAEYGELRVRICGECGYSELFVENPETLLHAYYDQFD